MGSQAGSSTDKVSLALATIDGQSLVPSQAVLQVLLRWVRT